MRENKTKAPPLTWMVFQYDGDGDATLLLQLMFVYSCNGTLMKKREGVYGTNAISWLLLFANCGGASGGGGATEFPKSKVQQNGGGGGV